MNTKCPFSYNSFIKLSLYNMIHIQDGHSYGPKHRIIKGLQCIVLSLVMLNIFMYSSPRIIDGLGLIRLFF